MTKKIFNIYLLISSICSGTLIVSSEVRASHSSRERPSSSEGGLPTQVPTLDEITILNQAQIVKVRRDAIRANLDEIQKIRTTLQNAIGEAEIILATRMVLAANPSFPLRCRFIELAINKAKDTILTLSVGREEIVPIEEKFEEILAAVMGFTELLDSSIVLEDEDMTVIETLAAYAEQKTQACRHIPQGVFEEIRDLKDSV